MRAIGEIVSAAIILGATGVVATIMLGAFSEQAQITTDDVRSRLDIMRAQAVEQIDVTSVSNHLNLTFLVVNYGDYDTTIPFMLYRTDGIEVTNDTVSYTWLNDTSLIQCLPTTPCTTYNTTLAARDTIRVDMPWGYGVDLIIITDTGRALRVDVDR